MGVLDDAIREHLDLKRRRGASEDELARAEAEALGPARRAVPPSDDDDEDLDVDRERVAGDLVALAEETRILDTPDEGEDEDEDEEDEEDVVPPPPSGPDRPTHAVHDIDEDPLAPPPPVERARAEPSDVEEPPVERAAAEPPEVEVEEAPAEPPPPGRPSIDDPIRWPREKPGSNDSP
jgi:hypothetical protein